MLETAKDAKIAKEAGCDFDFSLFANFAFLNPLWRVGGLKSIWISPQPEE